jgi:malonate decarboxylase beta subunit
MSTSPLRPTLLTAKEFLTRASFIELTARDQATALLDAGSSWELLGPFDRLSSPWLEAQGIVAQADDGVIVMRGAIDGRSVLVIAIEGGFQGGSMGEVSATKISASLDLARTVGDKGNPLPAILVLESGGVRLQEANLGLALTGDIHAAVIALRRVAPVIGLIPGMVGCFGGMAITASLCTHLIMTREGRLSLNGPEVIEQEAGIAEFDSHDRRLIWNVTGGYQRCAAGLADDLVEDDVGAIVQSIKVALDQGVSRRHRSERVAEFSERFAAIADPTVLDNPAIRSLLATAADER